MAQGPTQRDRERADYDAILTRIEKELAEAGLARQQTKTDAWKTGAAIALAGAAVFKLIDLL